MRLLSDSVFFFLFFLKFICRLNPLTTDAMSIHAVYIIIDTVNNNHPFFSIRLEFCMLSVRRDWIFCFIRRDMKQSSVLMNYGSVLKKTV